MRVKWGPSVWLWLLFASKILATEFFENIYEFHVSAGLAPVDCMKISHSYQTYRLLLGDMRWISTILFIGVYLPETLSDWLVICDVLFSVLHAFDQKKFENCIFNIVYQKQIQNTKVNRFQLFTYWSVSTGDIIRLTCSLRCFVLCTTCFRPKKI